MEGPTVERDDRLWIPALRAGARDAFGRAFLAATVSGRCSPTKQPSPTTTIREDIRLRFRFSCLEDLESEEAIRPWHQPFRYILSWNDRSYNYSYNLDIRSYSES